VRFNKPPIPTLSPYPVQQLRLPLPLRKRLPSIMSIICEKLQHCRRKLSKLRINEKIYFLRNLQLSKDILEAEKEEMVNQV
jgi:hypothetical protein